MSGTTAAAACALLLETLARRRLGYDYPRWGVPISSPPDSSCGSMVALTNESAGSDGDVFSQAFKMLGLGPLIGKRTWGGVIVIRQRHLLADGTMTTQREFSFAFDDIGWRVENYGTDPDRSSTRHRTMPEAPTGNWTARSAISSASWKPTRRTR